MRGPLCQLRYVAESGPPNLLHSSDTPQKKASAALGEILSTVDAAGKRLARALADDVAEVVAGQSFVADQVSFYLDTATEVAPYIAVLRRRGELHGWAQVVGAIPSVAPGQRVGREDVQRLGDALARLEIAAVRAERAPARPRPIPMATLGEGSTWVPAPAQPAPTTTAAPAPSNMPTTTSEATPNVAAKIALASARALVGAGNLRGALSPLDQLLIEHPKWMEALRLRGETRAALAGPESTLAALASPIAGRDYKSMAMLLRGAVDDLRRCLELAPVLDERLVAVVGDLQARAAAAERLAGGKAQ